ncbi:MAG: hypothetical protein ACE5IY_21355 [bacterium]
MSTFLVGVAIAVGLNLAQIPADEANRDALITELNQLSFVAQAYFMRPAVMAGGSGSFNNFKIPASFLNSSNGKIEHIKQAHGKDHIHFQAVGRATGKDGVNPIMIEVRVEVHEIKYFEHN